MTTTTNREAMFGTFDGFDTIEAAQLAGWHVFSSWGEEGWDAGEWPLVMFAVRRVEGARPQVNDRVEALYYVEGDITVDTFDGPDAMRQAERHLDGIILWHWQHGSSGPGEAVDGYTADNLPDRYRGPFRWHRICVADGKPACRRCQDAGKVIE